MNGYVINKKQVYHTEFNKNATSHMSIQNDSVSIIIRGKTARYLFGYRFYFKLTTVAEFKYHV